MQLKGRHWVLLVLALFLGVATLVTARQSSAYRTARRVAELKEERAALEARRAELIRRIRIASGRQVLGRTAEERLGLHQPSDSEFVLIPAPRVTGRTEEP
ncbi:MAG TPA: hypothetical protein VNK43_10425 [Gemmatimonadales bacterium]|nr:hypothetical protein [Gemmatimonadales bacterium]